jgi:hypothetical protein
MTMQLVDFALKVNALATDCKFSYLVFGFLKLPLGHG